LTPVLKHELAIKLSYFFIYQAHLNFGRKLTTILLNYWKQHHNFILQEAEKIHEILKTQTTVPELNRIQDLLSTLETSIQQEYMRKR
jgi:hypothetical protein